MRHLQTYSTPFSSVAWAGQRVCLYFEKKRATYVITLTTMIVKEINFHAVTHLNNSDACHFLDLLGSLVQFHSSLAVLDQCCVDHPPQKKWQTSPTVVSAETISETKCNINFQHKNFYTNKKIRENLSK